MVRISECAFPDELMICMEREKDLQHNLELWKDELTKMNLIK